MRSVMTLEQLRIFLAVAERGHMSRAAEALAISQSGASSAIRALESEFGVRLFNRVGRGIELSQAGIRFVPEAKAVLERADAARLVLENVSEVVAGAVSVAASLTIASYWLPHRLAAFHERHPNVRLGVSVGNTQQVETQILDGTADIGLVEGRTRSDLLKRVTVGTDRLVMVVGAQAQPISARQVMADPRVVRWVVRERGSGTREVLEAFVAARGVALDELRVSLVLPSNEAIRQAVEAGAGATIISEHVVARSIADGRLVVVPVEIPRREFALISHRDRAPGPAQAALKEHLCGRAG
jgi:DNA-binding transcriptional LysR family regulator